MNIKAADSMIDEILEKVDHWEIYAQKANVDPDLISSISATLLKL